MIALLMSSTRAEIPQIGPHILNKFVAPVLPLPWSRISIPLTILPIKRPNGIDPIKYAEDIIRTAANKRSQNSFFPALKAHPNWTSSEAVGIP